MAHEQAVGIGQHRTACERKLKRAQQSEQHEGDDDRQKRERRAQLLALQIAPDQVEKFHTRNVKHPTSNIQRPTSNRSARISRIGCWMLDVERWMFPIALNLVWWLKAGLCPDKPCVSPASRHGDRA